MIEETVIDYLSGKLPVPVYAELPDTLPAAFVVVAKTGSGKQDFIMQATFAVQSYAGTLSEAASLNETVKDAMNCVIDLDIIAKSKLNTDYPFPNPTTKKYRYQAVYDITHY